MNTSNLLYLLLIVPALLSWLAQAKVRQTYETFRQQAAQNGMRGLDVAKDLLARCGLTHIPVEITPGILTDHYDPEKKVLGLTEQTAQSSSITALGIVAHEVGHAVQDAQGYTAMNLRTKLAKPLSAAARWSTFVFIGGMWLGIPVLMVLGGLMLAGMVVFAMVTLPVERNASVRAEEMLQSANLVNEPERLNVRKVLRAAAFTYLANLGRRLASFLFFAAIIGAYLSGK